MTALAAAQVVDGFGEEPEGVEEFAVSSFGGFLAGCFRLLAGFFGFLPVLVDELPEGLLKVFDPSGPGARHAGQGSAVWLCAA